MAERYRSSTGRRLRVLAVMVAVVVGSGLLLIAFTFGRCDAFGGSCPAEPPPLVDDDTFRFAALGAAIAAGVPVLLAGDRDRPRWGAALVVAAVAGVVVGLAARGGAAG